MIQRPVATHIAARHFNMSRETVRRLCHRGIIPHQQLFKGGKIVVFLSVPPPISSHDNAHTKAKDSRG
jgi:hypothetical protein